MKGVSIPAVIIGSISPALVPWQLGVSAMLSVWDLWVVGEEGLAPLGHVIPSSGRPRDWLVKVLLSFIAEYRGSPGTYLLAG